MSPFPVPERLGPYRVLHEIGRGGQAVVFLAEDTRIARKVALKVLPARGLGSDAALRRFRREAEVTGRIEHPAICPIYEADVDGGMPFIAMRFVDGETLQRRVQKATPQAASVRDGEQADPVRWAVFFAKAARALEVAHLAGVLHRDIKPANLMATPAGEPVILDFGLARQDSDDAGLSRTGEHSGTPTYMSPEQMLGRGGLDRRADVYGLGCTLFECLTGRPPFVAPTFEGLLNSVLHDDVPDARRVRPELPADLAVVVATATAKDRERRYRTAADFAEDLERFARGESILARPATRRQRLWRWTKRNPALATTLATAALLLLTAAAALSYGIGAAGRAKLETQLRAKADQERARIEAEQALAARAAADRQLSARLDDLTMRHGTLVHGVQGGAAAVDALRPAYEAAFRSVGLDFDSSDSVAAGRELLRRLTETEPRAARSLRWALGNFVGLVRGQAEVQQRARDVLAAFDDPVLAPFDRALQVWRETKVDEFGPLVTEPRLRPLTADQLVEASGKLYGVVGREELAMELLDRAILLQPDAFAFQFQRAGLAMGIGSASQVPEVAIKAAQTAVEHARAAVALRPTSGLARAVLAGAMAMRAFRSGDPAGYPASWAVMETATAVEPDNGLVWFLQADYMRRAPGGSEGAKAACRRALELEPGLVPAQRLLRELGG